MPSPRRAALRVAEAANFAFGEVSANPQLAMAHVRIADGALRFLEQGLTDPSGLAKEVCIGAFTAMVKAAMLKRLEPPMLGADMRCNGERWDADLALAMQSFHRAFKDNCEYLFGNIAPPWIGGCSDKAEAASAQAVLGQPPAEAPKNKNPLELAYQMARFNVQRCEQRIGVLFALANVVRGGQQTLPAPAQGEFDAASARFFQRRAVHVSRMLGMGLLLGGDAEAQCKAYVKNQYREGISIMELLEVDGIHPGRYLVTAEQKFRRALDKA